MQTHQHAPHRKREKERKRERRGHHLVAPHQSTHHTGTIFYSCTTTEHYRAAPSCSPGGTPPWRTSHTATDASAAFETMTSSM